MVMVVEPGDIAPEFELDNAHPLVGSERMSLSDVLTDSGAIIAFSCLHCPYVVGSVGRINDIHAKAIAAGLGFVAINSNAANPNYESDSAEKTREACEKGTPYAYLIDEDQSVAAAYGAERTPEFYLLDRNGIIKYRGRLDDSPKDPSLATTHELMDAIDALLLDEEPETPRTDSIGCSVKWKV